MDIRDALPTIALIILVLFVLCCIFSLVLNNVDQRNIEDKDKAMFDPKTYTINLGGINSFNNTAADIFVLGTKTVSEKKSEKEYYIAYKVLEDEGKKIHQMPVEITTIYEILNIGEQAYSEEYQGALSSKIESIKLYVPKGTIIDK